MITMSQVYDLITELRRYNLKHAHDYILLSENLLNKNSYGLMFMNESYKKTFYVPYWFNGIRVKVPLIDGDNYDR